MGFTLCMTEILNNDYEPIEDTSEASELLLAALELCLWNQVNELRTELVTHGDDYELVENIEEWIKTVSSNE